MEPFCYECDLRKETIEKLGRTMICVESGHYCSECANKLIRIGLAVKNNKAELGVAFKIIGKMLNCKE